MNISLSSFKQPRVWLVVCAILVIGALFFYLAGWQKIIFQKAAVNIELVPEEKVTEEIPTAMDAEVVPITEPVKSSTTIIFVGDVMLSRYIDSIMRRQGDWKFPFLKIVDILTEADLLIGNLEGPISSGGIRSGSIYSFRADPLAIEGLIFAGFDIMSVANNHIWDYGEEACSDTLKILEENSIAVIGGGNDWQEAHAPVIREVNGIKIAFLGYTNLLPRRLAMENAEPAISFLDEEQMVADIKKAEELADIVVVSPHWGEEYKTEHNSLQEALARAAIDAGAELVVGHHPHVVQDTEEYWGGYIAYSLGNFIFDQNFSEDTRKGMILKVVLEGDRIAQVEPMVINFTPQFQPFMPPISD